MKVAIVYDRANKWGGAERVLLALNEIFPDAELFTSVYSNKQAKWAVKFEKINTSFIQTIPFAKQNHEYLAPLMPLAFESFDFSKFDLVISVTSEAAKGIITQPKTKHICYCLTPTRYLWSGYNDYFKNPIHKTLSKPVVEHLRSWDKIAARRPDKVIAISKEVKNRILKYYEINSEIIYPPVNLDKFLNSKKPKKQDYYLIVARLVKYKKVDLAIKAFNRLNKKLIIIGTGREEEKLKKIAQKNIKFLSKLTDNELKYYYSGAKALIFPQVEDFGLVSLEAQAAGTPVIVYDRAGGAETLISGKTGVKFKKQTVTSIINAVNNFEKKQFKHKDLIKNAKKYDHKIFKDKIRKLVNEV